MRSIISVRSASDLTVAELKDKLKELGLPYMGNKNELIIRLNETDPSGIWTEKLFEEEETKSADSSPTRELERHLREKRRMEVELGLLRQEFESLRASLRPARMPDSRVNAEPSVVQPRINLTAIAELLAIFNGTTGDFETWEKQLRLLK